MYGFFAKDVNEFLLIDKLEDTKLLQTVIEDFVLKELEEVWRVMERYLKPVPTCTESSTTLAQLLNFYCFTTPFVAKKELIKKAFDNFKTYSCWQGSRFTRKLLIIL
ncbi:hypothetical protein DFH28DRAFT_951489 [Melampsora americana]|nr:hypothetical protein DFH28DRAFT_951489 [Melampsora americana]